VDVSVPFMLNYRYTADRSALMNDQRVIDASGRYHAVSYYRCIDRCSRSFRAIRCQCHVSFSKISHSYVVLINSARFIDEHKTAVNHGYPNSRPGKVRANGSWPRSADRIIATVRESGA